MQPRRLVLLAGIALTTFLVVAAVVSELAAPAIEFSVFLGIPAGIIAAGIAVVAAGRALGAAASPARLAIAAAVATEGYAVLGGFAIRYAVASTRSVLRFSVIGGLSLLLAVSIGVAVWYRASGSLDPTDRA